MHAAVNGQYLACDVRSIIRAEEVNYVCDIFRLAVTLERDQFKDGFLLLVSKSISHGSLNESRSDGIERDVFLKRTLLHRT